MTVTQNSCPLNIFHFLRVPYWTIMTLLKYQGSCHLKPISLKNNIYVQIVIIKCLKHDNLSFSHLMLLKIHYSTEPWNRNSGPACGGPISAQAAVSGSQEVISWTLIVIIICSASGADLYNGYLAITVIIYLCIDR